MSGVEQSHSLREFPSRGLAPFTYPQRLPDLGQYFSGAAPYIPTRSLRSHPGPVGPALRCAAPARGGGGQRGHGRRRGSLIRRNPSQEDMGAPAPTPRAAGPARNGTMAPRAEAQTPASSGDPTARLRPLPFGPPTAAQPWPIPRFTQFSRFRGWWRFGGFLAVFIRSS